MSLPSALKALVNGRVQGVGFRYFAQALARQYGLKGYVRNLADGSVEVLAVGERQVLEVFVRDLRQGPPGARVGQCQVRWLDACEPYADFTIRP